MKSLLSFISAYDSLYTTPVISSLQQLISYSLTPRRSSVWCRVICSRPTNTSSTNQTCQSWMGQLFVTDSSLHNIKTQEAQCCSKTSPTQGSQQSGETSSTQEAHDVVNQYLKIDIRPSYTMTESLCKAVCDTGGVFYFQDIVYSGTGKYTNLLSYKHHYYWHIRVTSRGGARGLCPLFWIFKKSIIKIFWFVPPFSKYLNLPLDTLFLQISVLSLPQNVNY